MAFIATKSPDEAYLQLKQKLRQVDALCTEFLGAAAAGSVGLLRITGFGYDLKRISADLNALTQVPGIAAYAQAQEGSPAYDPVSEYTATSAAITAVMQQIQSTLPLNTITFGANDLNYPSFTPAQTATLRGLAQAVADSITV